ncbi:MAG: superoxide dismutase [Phenylobacterium sp.]|uniref:superoxide dismutase n=1 Tax=Phenylobacterium sp. TaxID=1871053 RepID=UPI00271E89C6|nr:superoxide dismutase [Phenylobacterium sp.]MDO8411838.1 superoxide dismutase [Phenylobacterium sp.]
MRSLTIAFASALALGGPAFVLAAAPTASAQSAAAFELAPLPYAADALEPVIDAETMNIHYGRHHQGYVTNLNKAVSETPALQGKSLEAILGEVSAHPAAVRNNAGGHYNHTLFWRLMAPQGAGGEPSDALSAQIEKDFGSLDAFKEAFQAAGAQRFGSGWAWLVWTGDKLAVASTPNQDNPLMDDAAQKGAPIIANDVWEHAYYLKHQNNRGAYLSGWWSVLNWNEANRLFAEATR